MSSAHTLFNIFLERIMSDALKEHDGKVSIGGRNITNLRFADDIDALAEKEQHLEALEESLDKSCTWYKMEISAEKTKLMTNSANGIQREIKVKGQVLGTVTCLKYLGALVSDDDSKTRGSLKDCTSNCSSYKAEAHLERKQHISWIKGETDALPCHFHISVYL